MNYNYEEGNIFNLGPMTEKFCSDNSKYQLGIYQVRSVGPSSFQFKFHTIYWIKIKFVGFLSRL